MATLEREGSRPQGSEVGGCGVCGGEGDYESDACLGHLALLDSYRDQYQLITAEALDLAKRVDDLVSPAELFELSHALYVSGDVQSSSEYVGKLLKSNPVFILRYRARILQAQIAFFQRDLGKGNNYTREALNLVADHPELTNVERDLLSAEARLVCASMHRALGKRGEGRECLREAYYSLLRLPNTTLVSQLKGSVRKQLKRIIVDEEKERQEKTEEPEDSFEELEEEIRREIQNQNAVPAAPVEAA